MNRGEEKVVQLKNPVRVIITYYIARVDENGTLHFANDMYGHDETMAGKMFADPH